MTDIVGYQPVTIETIDRAIRDWFDKTVDARTKIPGDELKKVPVVFSSGERWSVGRTKQVFRDENGVLIFPIIAIRRTSIDPDPTKMALGVQTKNIQFAKLIDVKTNQIQNLEQVKSPPWRRDYPPVYDVYTVPFPDRMITNYQLVIQTQYISQMNDILQKIWRSLDIQKSFVARFENNGEQSPKINQYGTGNPYEKNPALSSRYVVGFLESSAADGGNFEEFTDGERIIKYSTEIKVPCALQSQPEGEPPIVKVERTAYKVVIKDENFTFVNSQEEMDSVFGKLR